MLENPVGQNKPSVAAIVTCMTDAERPYIGDALRSVLAQTVPCKVLLAISDSSTAFDEIGAEFPTITVVKLPLMPVGIIRNALIGMTGAEWVAFLDGDDVWRADKIEMQLAVARRREVDFVGADHELINESGKVCAFNIARNIPMPSTWLVRRSLMNERPFGGDPVIADANWWIENWPLVTFARLPEFLVEYRVREVSLSSHVRNKRNKYLAVKLAENPVLRPLVLASTWLVNRARRSEFYVWRTQDWGPPPKINGAERTRSLLMQSE